MVGIDACGDSMTIPPNNVIDLLKPHRRTVGELAALTVLLAIGAVLTWEIMQTANASLPAVPAAQSTREATLVPVSVQQLMVVPTTTPEDTSTPKPTPSPLPTIIYCGNGTNPGQICTVPVTPLPTPTPMMRCDDARLIGGQFCLWPTPTAEPSVNGMWK
jgi:hypothetical protein